MEDPILMINLYLALFYVTLILFSRQVWIKKIKQKPHSPFHSMIIELNKRHLFSISVVSPRHQKIIFIVFGKGGKDFYTFFNILDSNSEETNF